MEISNGLSIGQAIFQSLVTVSVQKIAMENMEQNSEAIRQMMERSLTPHIGGNLDLKG